MSFVTPTIKVKITDLIAEKIAEEYLTSNPDVTVDEINSAVISEFDRASQIRTLRAPVAVFIEEGVEVKDFEATVSQSWTHEGDRYLMLVSGDIVNYSQDSRAAAVSIREMIRAA